MIFFFVLFHLMHLTWGTPIVHGDYIRGDAYHNLVSGFQFFPVTLIYLAGVVALGFHLFHGTWSMFQTLGLNNQDYEPFLRGLAWILAIVVPVGFAIVPISVMLGIVQ